MDMVGHQAVTPHRDAVFAALMSEEIAVEFVVGVAEKTLSRRLARCVT
jgi:hypothetical protein